MNNIVKNIMCLVPPIFASVTYAQSAYLEVVSDAGTATPSNGASTIATRQSMSEDGRYITFNSAASNLVANDTNGFTDVFVRDRQTNTTTLVSKHTDGTQGNQTSRFPVISGDGRYVAFMSTASNLVANDTNNQEDVFVHDLQTGETKRIDVDTAGNQANQTVDSNSRLSISADGRYIAFVSFASNLVANDTNNMNDVFVHDRGTLIIPPSTTRVSIDSGGVQGNGSSTYASISGDGNLIAFRSDATNLVMNDTNVAADIFVHNRQTSETKRINVVQGQPQSNTWVGNCTTLSIDGRYVGFSSGDDNLVPGDTNVKEDSFLYDLQTQAIRRVSVNKGGIQGNNDSYCPTLSSNNQFVIFGSNATNLVLNGNVGTFVQLFLHDLRTGVTTQLSQDKLGVLGNGHTNNASISEDGLFISFSSQADNWTIDAGTKGPQQDVFVAKPDYIFAYGMEVVPQ